MKFFHPFIERHNCKFLSSKYCDKILRFHYDVNIFYYVKREYYDEKSIQEREFRESNDGTLR